MIGKRKSALTKTILLPTTTAGPLAKLQKKAMPTRTSSNILYQCEQELANIVGAAQMCWVCQSLKHQEATTLLVGGIKMFWASPKILVNWESFPRGVGKTSKYESTNQSLSCSSSLFLFRQSCSWPGTGVATYSVIGKNLEPIVCYSGRCTCFWRWSRLLVWDKLIHGRSPRAVFIRGIVFLYTNPSFNRGVFPPFSCPNSAPSRLLWSNASECPCPATDSHTMPGCRKSKPS